MVFSSSIFIFIFLPITLLLYYVVSKIKTIKLSNVVLLLCSCVFYAWGGLRPFLLLLLLICINYYCVLLMSQKPKYKKNMMIMAIVIDIANLGYFKYCNFFVENAQIVWAKLFHKSIFNNFEQIALPIGISFFTFQIMSYVIDVYRGEVAVQKNIVKLALYVMMFPQLIAGPIVRYKDVNEEIEGRNSSAGDIEYGIKRFIVGFAKKAFLANSMGVVADAAFTGYENLNTVYAWLGAICYSFQIYYDFSGYSDMAIGLGRIFGFHFNENFNYPYISTSIKEFWRRWHISLSSWFRDYVYIPLGGNRKGKARTYCNLLIVFLLTGIWHGAAWQFAIWGLYHGMFLIVERIGFGKVLEKVPNVIRHLYMVIVVLVGWVFFRADNINQACCYIKNMFVFNFHAFNNADIVLKLSNIFIVCLVVSIICCMPVRLPKEKVFKNHKALNVNLTRMLYLILWLVSVLYMVGLSYNPFIYFKF